MRQKKINSKPVWFYWIKTGGKDSDIMDIDVIEASENEIPF